MLQQNFPVKSVSSIFFGWVIPAWWHWLIFLACIDVFWFAHLEQINSRLDSISPEFISTLFFSENSEIYFLPSALAIGLFCMALFMLLISHRGPAHETTIFPDRLEFFDGKNRQVLRWKDIIIQGEDRDDIWSETIDAGKSSYSVIRMDVRDAQHRTPMRLSYNLSPVGRNIPGYRNKAEIRRAWLLTLLHARPELRIDLNIYAACKVSPATLKYSLHNTLGLWIYAAVATLTLAATGYTVALPPGEMDFWNFMITIASCITAGIVSVFVLAQALGKYLLIDPESPSVRAARRRLLGPDMPKPYLASTYPLISSKAHLTSDHAALSKRQQRIENLINNPKIPADYPWDDLDGDDWYLLINKRPDLAPHCRWKLLDGEAWAFLLPEQPDWAEHCDWRKLEPGDWATLISAAPQFDDIFLQHIGWGDFDGTDWATLLANRPALLPHCNLQLLDSGNWAYLIYFQPDLAQHCPLRPLPDSHD